MAAGDLAAVLAQLAAVTTRLERVERAQAQPADDGDQALREQVAALAAQFEELTTLVGASADPDEGHGGARVTPIWWPALSDEDYATLRPELRGWLRDVLAARYPRDAGKLLACWEKHPTAVDLLTALWVTWAAGLLAASADARDAAEWHLRWRPDLIEAAREDLAGCAKGHQEPVPLRVELLASFEP